jgi:CheY-like chemotaxis protein
MARILIVEDCEFQRAVLARLLRQIGHETVLAADGREAGELAGRIRFDLVITDILMPRCDGIELIQSLRRKEQSVPVLAMTADGPRDYSLPYLRFAHAFGATAQLSKSAPVPELLATVSALLPESCNAA